MVDEAYSDREEWIKKSIRTTAKACHCFAQSLAYSQTSFIDGQIQL